MFFSKVSLFNKKIPKYFISLKQDLCKKKLHAVTCYHWSNFCETSGESLYNLIKNNQTSTCLISYMTKPKTLWPLFMDGVYFLPLLTTSLSFCPCLMVKLGQFKSVLQVFLGRYSPQLPELASFYLFYYSDRLDFSATLLRCYKDISTNSFFSFTVRLQKSLLADFFPLNYHSNCNS